MEWFVKLIRQYQSTPGLACAYGVILYRDTDAHVSGVVESDKYCKALNELSGARWLIFASRATTPVKATRSLRAMRLQFRGSLSAEWQGSEDKLALLQTLGLQSMDQLPCLLIMCVGDDELAHVLHVPIKGKCQAEMFESLRASVQSVTQAVNELDPQYLKNAESVHRVIHTRLQSDRHWQLAKNSLPFLNWLLSKLGGL